MRLGYWGNHTNMHPDSAVSVYNKDRPKQASNFLAETFFVIFNTLLSEAANMKYIKSEEIVVAYGD